jgi:coenzyme F420-0:L-glutamate ligase/coenzyme F420-1:gamma-L-glutamate ligase
MAKRLEIIGLRLPLFERGTDLAKSIVDAALSEGIDILNGDVVVVTDKVVSKCFGRIVKAEEVKPSNKALKLSEKTGLEPKFVELVIKNCDKVIAVVPFKRLVERGFVNLRSLSADEDAAKKLIDEYPDFFITVREDMLWSDSGIDSSNLPPNTFALPVENHDEFAKAIRNRIAELTGRRVAVVICDTEIFLEGSMDFARGSYGIDPVDRRFACLDLYGKPKYGGVDAIAHEICAAAALLFKQAREGVPVAIVRGLEYRECECGLRDSMPKISLLPVLKEIVRETRKVLGLRKSLKLIRLRI